MEHNITANRLRDYVEFKNTSVVPGDKGQVVNLDELVFDAYADVQVKNGEQLNGLGIAITESVITVLCWFNDKVSSNQIVVWNGGRYEIQNIQPSGKRKSMMVTAKCVGTQTYA